LISLAAGLAVAVTSTVALAQSAPATKPAAAPAAKAAGAAAGAHYTTAATTIGTMMADPAAKAVLNKYIPDMIANPQFEQAGSMTLKDVQQYAGDALSDAKLSQIDADLAKIPGK